MSLEKSPVSNNGCLDDGSIISHDSAICCKLTKSSFKLVLYFCMQQKRSLSELLSAQERLE